MGSSDAGRHELRRRWQETWDRAGKALEDIRRAELPEPDTLLPLDQIDDLLSTGLLHAAPRETSGLVEQQRAFARFRLRGGAK